MKQGIDPLRRGNLHVEQDRGLAIRFLDFTAGQCAGQESLHALRTLAAELLLATADLVLLAAHFSLPPAQLVLLAANFGLAPPHLFLLTADLALAFMLHVALLAAQLVLALPEITLLRPELGLLSTQLGLQRPQARLFGGEGMLLGEDGPRLPEQFRIPDPVGPPVMVEPKDLLTRATLELSRPLEVGPGLTAHN